MIYRPVDENGDILPILSSSDLIRGAPAVAQFVKDRLCLLTGDWWENPSWGNEVLDMLIESRMTEADEQAFSSYLSSYVLETSGVRDARNVLYSLEGKQMRFSCEVETDDGIAGINYELR